MIITLKLRLTFLEVFDKNNAKRIAIQKIVIAEAYPKQMITVD